MVAALTRALLVECMASTCLLELHATDLRLIANTLQEDFQGTLAQALKAKQAWATSWMRTMI
eukprot:931941-Prorocentrum_lima.AAC.1